MARSLGETHTLRTGPALMPLAYIFAFQLDVVAKQLIGEASGDSWVRCNPFKHKVLEVATQGDQPINRDGVVQILLSRVHGRIDGTVNAI